MSQVLAWWRRGYAEGDALPAPQGLGNLGPALEQDAAAFSMCLALLFLFIPLCSIVLAQPHAASHVCFVIGVKQAPVAQQFRTLVLCSDSLSGTLQTR